MSNNRPSAGSPSSDARSGSAHQDRASLAAQASSEPWFPGAEPRGADRRAVVRRRFPHKQYIAPYLGGCLPSRASFKEVVCRDLSEQGFSFLASSAPDFDCVVVALGVSPDLIHMTALHDGASGESGPRLGGAASALSDQCRFTGRLN